MIIAKGESLNPLAAIADGARHTIFRASAYARRGAQALDRGRAAAAKAR